MEAHHDKELLAELEKCQDYLFKMENGQQSSGTSSLMVDTLKQIVSVQKRVLKNQQKKQSAIPSLSKMSEKAFVDRLTSSVIEKMAKDRIGRQRRTTPAADEDLITENKELMVMLDCYREEIDHLKKKISHLEHANQICENKANSRYGDPGTGNDYQQEIAHLRGKLNAANHKALLEERKASMLQEKNDTIRALSANVEVRYAKEKELNMLLNAEIVRIRQFFGGQIEKISCKAQENEKMLMNKVNVYQNIQKELLEYKIIMNHGDKSDRFYHHGETSVDNYPKTITLDDSQDYRNETGNQIRFGEKNELRFGASPKNPAKMVENSKRRTSDTHFKGMEERVKLLSSKRASLITPTDLLKMQMRHKYHSEQGSSSGASEEELAGSLSTLYSGCSEKMTSSDGNEADLPAGIAEGSHNNNEAQKGIANSSKNE